MFKITSRAVSLVLALTIVLSVAAFSPLTASAAATTRQIDTPSGKVTVYDRYTVVIPGEEKLQITFTNVALKFLKFSTPEGLGYYDFYVADGGTVTFNRNVDYRASNYTYKEDTSADDAFIHLGSSDGAAVKGVPVTVKSSAIYVATDAFFVNILNLSGAKDAHDYTSGNTELTNLSVFSADKYQEPVKPALSLPIVEEHNTLTDKYVIKEDNSLWQIDEAIGKGGASKAVKIMDGCLSVSYSSDAAYAIKTDHTLWAWGCNYHYTNTLVKEPSTYEVVNHYGLLGAGNTKDKYITTPTKILDDVVKVINDEYLTHDILAFGAAYYAIKSDGSLWGWGKYIGDGTKEIVSTPKKLMDNVVDVSLRRSGSSGTEESIKHILKSDGTLWGFGMNNFGEVGIGGRSGSTRYTEKDWILSPVFIMNDVIKISGGAAIKSDGSLWYCGEKNWLYPEAHKVTDITGEYEWIADNVKSVSDGEVHDYNLWFIKNDGSLWLYGNPNGGWYQTPRKEKAPIKILDGVSSVYGEGHFYFNNSASDSSHFFAITSNNRLMGWGRNAYISDMQLGKKGRYTWGGYLGLASEVEYVKSPVEVMSNISAVAGYINTLYLKADGSLWWSGMDINNSVFFNPLTKLMDGVKLPSSKTVQLPTAAAPSTIKVSIDGKPAALEAYTIGGNSYFKLRDIAYTLSRTAKQFDASYDGKTNTTAITTGVPYKPTGGEMAKRGVENKNAAPSAMKLTVNGKAANITAYIIDGSAYYEISDLAKTLNFAISHDGVTNTVAIKTSVGYSAR